MFRKGTPQNLERRFQLIEHLVAGRVEGELIGTRCQERQDVSRFLEQGAV